MLTKLMVELYWVVLIMHNIRNRNQHGYVPLLIIVNAIVILLLGIDIVGFNVEYILL